ncbi:MAG: hypothetical protein E7501_05620 [Ruminococcus sp.]|nr:hypothetical protein [Ruminococcus sp.]MBQ8906312.1 hypothetical protein [Ruminococcus sp.]
MDDLMKKMQEVMSDPESLAQLNELAAMLQDDLGDSTAEAVSQGDAVCSSESDFDFSKLLQIGQMLGGTEHDDKNAALLLALRPHLSTERQNKIDRAVKLLKLYTIYTMLRDSGMLKDML